MKTIFQSNRINMKRIIYFVLGAIKQSLNHFIFILKYQVIIRRYKDPDYATIASSSLFDKDWYLFYNEDVATAKVDPVDHYLHHGWKEKRNPSPLFDGSSYHFLNPDVENAGINPLLHYEKIGRREKRKYHKTNGVFIVSEINPFVPLLNASPLTSLPVKIIAFYLPQFHEILENNEWWGKGFTEWTNVKKARPLFKGHYQPHFPGELGYYNLLDGKVMKRQVELAQLYGIGGFCFYFYWFNGKRLLETPILNYLSDSSLDLPFCLCWANENWTRRWDGYDSEILISQEYSSDDDIGFIKYVSKYFDDQRYIRIDGKPLLIVYRPAKFPHPAQTTDRWREWLRNNKQEEIYLAYVQSFERVVPLSYGFDAAIEFPPDKSNDVRIFNGIKPLKRKDILNVFNWESIIEKSQGGKIPNYKLFQGVCPSWDNTPRRKSAGSILVNNSPELFESWVSNVISGTINRFKFNLNERLIFVNAWNEWAEGAHLEPDEKYGYAWLQAIRNALSMFSQIKPLKIEENKKSILFDLLFCQGGFHGGGEYGKAVFLELINKVISRSDCIIYVAMNPKFSIDESILDLFKINHEFIRVLNVNNLDDIRKLVNTDLFDAFFAPALVVYAQGYQYLKTAGKSLGFHCSNTRIIGTLHDIRDFEMALDYSKIYYFRKAIGCKFENKLSTQKLQKNIRSFVDYADGLKEMYQKIMDDEVVTNIITVSDYSMKSMKENFNVNNDLQLKFSVLYSCMKHRYSPEPFSFKGYDFEKLKYFLSINLGRSEKNGSAIAKAIDELVSENLFPDNYYAVLTGIENLAQLDIEIRNRDRFIVLGFLSPENLEHLYKNTECLIYASLSEGFGYPPIEAMSYNVPSVVSEISAIPEICRDAAIYCDPYSVSSIKEAIIKYIKKPLSKEILRDRYAFITSKQINDLNKLIEIILN